MFYDIKANCPKFRWYEISKKISNFFLFLAKKFYKENPEIRAFYCKLVMDQMITGKAITRVDPLEINESYHKKRKDHYKNLGELKSVEELKLKT